MSCRIEARNCSGEPNIAGELERGYIAIDLETTGFSPQNDRIIEFSAVYYVNGRDVDRFTTLIRPDRTLSSATTAINGITDEMLHDAPNEEEAVWDIVEYIRLALTGETLICAHNARFDIEFLSEVFRKYSIPADMRYVDTLGMSRKWFRGLKSYRLGSVADYLGISRETEHRAEEDAVVCGEICRALYEQAKCAEKG